MNRNQSPLFNPKLLYNYYKKIDISKSKIDILNNKVFNLPEEAITQSKKSGNEENVKNKIVIQLIKFLGFDEQLDVNYEVSKQRRSIDVTLNVSEESKIPNALIEVKYWKKDLDKLKKNQSNRYRSDVQQGLFYAHENGIDWFIITNGYEWRFYKTYISGQMVYNFYEEFTLDTLKQEETLKKFYLLCSKDSFIKNLQKKLFSETELLKEKINEEIFDILVNCRSGLFSDIFRNNKDFLNEREIMEVGQKILDRFIFIRFAEDNHLFPNKILNQFLNNWKGLHSNLKERTPLFNFINDLFSYVRDGSVEDNIFGYDGELFDKDNLIGKIRIDNFIIEDIINKLYKYPDGKYIDFSEIPIDILGQIYEKYLALSLQIKEEGSTVVLEEKSTKAIRKKTGIYYTPKYIVHFIIEQTIIKILNENLNILPQLKILDPACGSGAFLSQAYDILYFKYGEYNEVINSRSAIKTKDIDMKKYLEILKDYKTEFDKKILTNNLYGVDINPESIEITKMSLWFKTAQKDIPLNKLEANIKCGDSLIDNQELSKEKAFNWGVNFPDTFKKGGFDVIIGNPPYFKIRKENPITQIDEYKQIKIAVVNAAAVFLNRSFKLLKDKGILGFIVPKQVAFANSWRKLREKIFNNFKVLFVIDCGKAFEGVLLEQVIIILQKDKENVSNLIKIGKVINQEINIRGEVSQLLCKEADRLYLDYDPMIHNIRVKIVENSLKLENLATIQGGVGINYLMKKGVFKEKKINKDNLIVIRGKDIQQYYLRSWLYFDKNHPELKKRQSRIIDPPIKKMVVQRIVAHIRDHIKITASIDEKSSITFDTVITVIPNDLDDIYYILGFLNSKLISYYLYKFIYNNAIRSMDFIPGIAKITPIFRCNEEQKQEISNIVLKLLDLNQTLLNYNEKLQIIFKKYSGVNKTKLGEILQNNFYRFLLKKDKKIKVREINTQIAEDLLLVDINGKEFLKLQIEDSIKRKYLLYFLDSLEIERLNLKEETPFQAFKQLEIDDYSDSKAIKTTIVELEKFTTKNLLKSEIHKLEVMLNDIIFNLYNFNEEEINHIRESFN